MIPNDQGRIILDGAILCEEYVPADLPGRRSQIKLLQSCLEPALRRRKPRHVWLHGRPGSGKTALARASITKLQHEASICSVTVNCWQRRSLYEILDQMIADLKIFYAEEHRSSVKLERLQRHLDGRCLLILLDEVDKISPSERSRVLYNLNALGNSGLICISNTLNALFEVEERVRSRVNPRTISFQTYSAGEIADILTKRAQVSLAPNACPAYLIKRIAAACDGDARVAIQALRHAAQSAEQKGRATIAPSDLVGGWCDREETKAARVLARLTEDHKIMHEIVVACRETLSTEVWKAYLEHCRRSNRKPVAVRTFSKYIGQLVNLGLLSCERARVKGNVRLLKPVK